MFPDFPESGRQSSREKKGSVRVGERKTEGGGERGYRGRATGNGACAGPGSRDPAAMMAAEAAVRSAGGAGAEAAASPRPPPDALRLGPFLAAPP